jgi:hypothetical protein
MTLTLVNVMDQTAHVVQCLELDIAAQGATADIAQDSFETTLGGQIALDKSMGRRPLEGIRGCPLTVWNELTKRDGAIVYEMEFDPNDVVLTDQ